MAEILREAFCLDGSLIDSFQVRANHLPEVLPGASCPGEEERRHEGDVDAVVEIARQVEQVSEEKVLLVHRLKSAYYTVSGPLRIGAILGGGGPALLKELEEIGLDLGIAFQLRDDVIGCGLNGKPGEKSANDLTEGKRTLLVVRARERGLPKSRAALEVALGNPKATDEEVRAAQRAIIDSGSLQYSEQRIRALEARASLRINKSRRLGPTGKQLLREIAEKLLWRDR